MPRITVLTPAGRGAVASLLLEGIAEGDPTDGLFAAANGVPLSAQPLNRICFGRWGIAQPEEIIACRISRDAIELHCHGGEAAVGRIISDLRRRGVAESCAGEGSAAEEPIEAACRRVLSRAATMRTADILWQQCEGRLQRAIDELAGLPASEARRRAAQMLRWADFGLHLSHPWQVVLFGRPNVGKSSLVNRLLGYGRSIVFDQPGTTRDVVAAQTALDGWPVEFSDTAGLRSDADDLEAEGIQRARRRLESADLRVLLIDAGRPPAAEDHELLREWPDALVVAHKCDLPDRWDAPPAGSISVSSLTGAGVEQLMGAITRRLIPEVPPPMTMLPVDAQQAARISAFL